MTVLHKHIEPLYFEGKDYFINWRVVDDSTNVDRIGWPVTGEPLMLVRFKPSYATYGYLGCPRQRSVAAASAKSVGRYLNLNVKPKYKAVRIV